MTLKIFATYCTSRGLSGAQQQRHAFIPLFARKDFDLAVAGARIYYGMRGNAATKFSPLTREQLHYSHTLRSYGSAALPHASKHADMVVLRSG